MLTSVHTISEQETKATADKRGGCFSESLIDTFH